MTTDISSAAREFFEACETGKGWAGCKDYCHDDATFSCQSDALAEITTVAAYADWMQGLMGLEHVGNNQIQDSLLS